MRPGWRTLLAQLSGERLGWFGAGLSAAALGVVGYQFVVAAVVDGPLPGPQPAPVAPTAGAHATATPWPTHTPRPTATPPPTRTPLPTRTPIPSPAAALLSPDDLARADPGELAGAFATLITRTGQALATLTTPEPR